jgi:hypothetical protein
VAVAWWRGSDADGGGMKSDTTEEAQLRERRWRGRSFSL